MALRKNIILFFLIISGIIYFIPSPALSSEYFTIDGLSSQTIDADHFVVEFNGTIEQLTATVDSLDGKIEFADTEFGLAKVSGISEVQAKKLRKNSKIKRVERDLIVQWVPNLNVLVEEIDFPIALNNHNEPEDAFFFDQLQWNMKQVQASDAWDIEQGDPSVRVCIMDTGIGPTHVDLVGRYDLDASVSFVDSEPFPEDLHYHGTFIAGIISTNNIGVAGIAPHITLVGVKVINRFGQASFSEIFEGIIYAIEDADCDVISMSFGAYFPKNARGGGALNAMMAKIVNHANTRGALVVVAAGNNRANLDKDKNFVFIPAQSGNAVSVSATYPGSQGNIDPIAPYSNYGVSGVNVAAPGGYFLNRGLITSTCAPLVCGNTSRYIIGMGTSFAAPMAAGIAALIDSQYGGDLNAGRLRTILERTADDLGKRGTDPLYGRGRVNAYKAVSQ